MGDATKDTVIVPVNFNKEHKAMLGHSKIILEQDSGKIAINPDKFDKLITALRTAVDNDEVLDKEATPYNDIFFIRFRKCVIDVYFFTSYRYLYLFSFSNPSFDTENRS